MGKVRFLFCALPVVVNHTTADEVNASLEISFRWYNIQIFRLIVNMRVQIGRNSLVQGFSDDLSTIAEGTLSEKKNQVKLTDTFGKNVQTLVELILSVYQESSEGILGYAKEHFNDESAAINNSSLSANSIHVNKGRSRSRCFKLSCRISEFLHCTSDRT
ncbi:hypothetical protein CDAR_249101 [Caerostris darwini]|uniref:Uncharacterized protein n=1 Tax=Caerostris darwini TaxID=1538125 RepID=A0AAV4QX69_9ARAC|nr:hypothetical protein CDAR_249101 [Caerostris darwini]